jgi:transporter family protein
MELWFLYAFGAAVLSAAATILAKIGLQHIDSYFATAVRTVVVVVVAWGVTALGGGLYALEYVCNSTWLFVGLSGLAVGLSWIFYFRALRIGEVNQVVPVYKSSTILAMIMAVVFLREPLTLSMVAAMILMAGGTWFIVEGRLTGGKWLLSAILSAVFMCLVYILSSLGVRDTDAYLWTALQTTAVLPICLFMYFFSREKVANTAPIGAKTWAFLITSGAATGGSWIFFYHALQVGNASHVVPIDRLSTVFTMLTACFFLGERLSRKNVIGVVLLTAGTLLPVIV